MTLSIVKVMWWTKNEYEALAKWYCWVEHQNTWTQACTGAANLTWTGLRLNPSLQSEKLATKNLSHDMASTTDELFPVDSNSVQCPLVFYQV
jgi:hypothetical protein